MNIVFLIAGLVIGLVCGFFIKSKKSTKRIAYLENEMLQDHAEILELQRKLSVMTEENKKSANQAEPSKLATAPILKVS